MKKGLEKTFIALSIIISALAAFMLHSTPANALRDGTDDSALVKIALLQGIYECYGNAEYINSSLELEKFSRTPTYEWLIHSNPIREDGSTENKILVPTQVGDKIAYGNDLSCKEVFSGREEQIPGLGELKGGSMIETATMYGYVPDSSQATAGSFAVNISITADTSNDTANTNSIGNSDSTLSCSGAKNNDGTFNIEGCSGYIIFSNPGNKFINEFQKEEYASAIESFNYDVSKSPTVNPGEAYLIISSISYGPLGFYYKSNTRGMVSEQILAGEEIRSSEHIQASSFSEAVKIYLEDILGDNSTVMRGALFSNVFSTRVVSPNIIISEADYAYGANPLDKYIFKNNSSEDAAAIAVENYASSNGQQPSYMEATRAWWTNPYIYKLYYRYLDHNGFLVDNGITGCGAEKPTDDDKYYFKNKSDEWCMINVLDPGNIEKNVNVVNDDHNKLERGTMSKVLEWFKDENNYENLLDEDYANLTVIENEDGTTTIGNPNSENSPEVPHDYDVANCYNSTSLGWVLCPAVDLFSGIVDSMYGMVEGEMVINTELIGSSSDGSGAYQGWQTFQNIANIALVIFILVIIISQVTGFGIDNYGIKKMLPKIIIAGVLLNLSFIICQFAADLSNIVGIGIKNLFEGFAPVVDTNSSPGAFANIFSTIMAGGAITGAAFLAFFTWSVWLIPLLLGLLGMVISILFFFILIEVRKALVVLLVVIAPLAVVCYILPNTKKWFDKWVKIFTSMLLLFPICGLVMGGGAYVSKLLIAASSGNQNFLFYLVAVLMNVIPFFFIPALFKSSMAGIGNLGAKISGLGKNLSGKAKGATGNSERVKDMQKRASMARNQQIYNKLKARQDSGKTLSSYQNRRMNNARIAYNNAMREDIAAAAGGAMLAEGSTAYDAAMKAQESATSKQELENQIIAMAGETNNYDADTMASQLGSLLSRNDPLSHEDEVKMKALMQQLTTKGGYGKKLLASTAGGASVATRSAAAKFMSKNGDVAAAMNKNMAIAQYLRDVNAGTTKASNFEEWSQEKTRSIDGKLVTNSKFVLSKVITNDADFVGQSASAVRSMLSSKEADGNYSLSDERLAAMVNNERLMDSADSDVRSAIIASAKERGMSIPERFGGGGSTSAPAGQGSGNAQKVRPSRIVTNNNSQSQPKIKVKVKAKTGEDSTRIDVPHSQDSSGPHNSERIY